MHFLPVIAFSHVKMHVFSAYNAVGRVVYTLPEGEPVCGVTSLADEVYVLRQKERDQVEVYDVTNYHLQRRLTVPNIRLSADMISCAHYRCVHW